jgi:hypothetical protein
VVGRKGEGKDTLMLESLLDLILEMYIQALLQEIKALLEE